MTARSGGIRPAQERSQRAGFDAPGSKALSSLISDREDFDPAAAINDLLLPDDVRTSIEGALGVPFERADLVHELTREAAPALRLGAPGRHVWVLHLQPGLLKAEYRLHLGDLIYRLRPVAPASVRIVSSARLAAPLVIANMWSSWRSNQIDVQFVPWQHVTEAAEAADPAVEFQHLLGIPVDALAGAEPPPPVGERSGVFLSYAHDDFEWKDRLLQMLAPVRDRIDVWVDDQIVPGDPWQDAIEAALAKAKVGVLLVTPAFLESRFVTEQEIPALLSAAKDAGARIYIVCVRDSMILQYPALARLDFATPTPADRPLFGRAEAEIDTALRQIGEEILSLLG